MTASLSTASLSATEMGVQRALEIPKLTHREAGRLSQAEYERVLALLESLEDEDWTQPTYCTEWNVRQMVAHLAGAVASGASFAEFRRQMMQNPYMKTFEKMEDGINHLQVLDRSDSTTAELVAEFRQSGLIAVRNRQKLPWLVRKIHMPMGSLGFSSLEYLMDIICPRDQWMHRYDICVATGKEMVVTAEHDGRIVALVLRELAQKLKRELAQRSVAVHLSGQAGGDFLFGRPSTPDCTLEMDVFDFNLRASGRITVAELASRTTVSGERALADWFFQNMEVPY